MWVVAGLWHNLIMSSLYKDSHASHDGIGVIISTILTVKTKQYNEPKKNEY